MGALRKSQNSMEEANSVDVTLASGFCCSRRGA